MVRLSAKSRQVVIGLLLINLVVLGLILFVVPEPDLSEEENLLRRAAQLATMAQQTDMTNLQRRIEVQTLFKQFSTIVRELLDRGENATAAKVTQLGTLLSPEGVAMLRAAFTTGHPDGRQDWSNELLLPSLYHVLPHVVNRPEALLPAFRLPSHGHVRDRASMVLGIPTVKREKQSYLEPTLKSVFANLASSSGGGGNGAQQPETDVLVVVLVAEPWDPDYVRQVAEDLSVQFEEQVSAGMLEVVGPPAEFYPDMASLRPTLGDPEERVRWRSKQNLDFAFLMMYACQRGSGYYVQLEDDIMTKPGFVKVMRDVALNHTARASLASGQLQARSAKAAKEAPPAESGSAAAKLSPKPGPAAAVATAALPWFAISFCRLGFIGKLFRVADLPFLVMFMVLFYNDQPSDWLLDEFLRNRYCGHEKKELCNKRLEQVYVQHKPSLFQHMGQHSSLKGKVQKLKDETFGVVSLFSPHKNPTAAIETSIRHYKHHSISRAYRGETFYWGLVPQQGDYIVFTLTPPVQLQGLKLVSGNQEHPSDRFSPDTTVEVLFDLVASGQKSFVDSKVGGGGGGNGSAAPFNYRSVGDDYVVVAGFDGTGVAQNPSLPLDYGPARAVRIHINSASTENWVILSEIHLKQAAATSS